MQTIKEIIHVCAICGEGIDRLPQGAVILNGDTFYTLTCEECSSDGQVRFERQLLSWRTAAHLVLYHLHSTAPAGKRYFRWKEDVCDFIDKSWLGLLPGKVKGVNWQNSVSSVLSSHGEIFRNGFEEMNEQGWWSLRTVEPPFMYPHTKTKPVKLEPIFTTDSPSGDVNEDLKKELLRKLLSVDKTILTKALNTATLPTVPAQTSASPSTVKRNPLTANRYLPISEADVLRRCLQITNPPVQFRRLIRKVINRRGKRKLSLPLFDLDQFIYEYLKLELPLFLGDPPIVLFEQQHQQQQRKQHNFYTGKVPVEQTWRAKMMGLTNVVEDWPTPFVSPFTGHTLPGVLCTLPQIRPPQYKLLQELKSFSSHSNIEAHEHMEEDAPFIKVCYLRKELVEQTSHLLREAFWPRIDVSEYLDAPDYCLLALYRFRVVCVALMSPEGYLDYLWTAPGWQSTGLARTLLYLLIRRCPARDITLHVAPDNFAGMRVYQELGFKVDRYVLGFYEKYFPVERSGCRNAFFMRLRK